MTNMFRRFRKRDYWTSVGGVDGFINAVKKLGSSYKELDVENQGYAEPDSVWGHLANVTNIPEKNTYDTRKWLYTNWRSDRRNVKSKFKVEENRDYSPEHAAGSSSNIKKDDNVTLHEVIA